MTIEIFYVTLQELLNSIAPAGTANAAGSSAGNTALSAAAVSAWGRWVSACWTPDDTCGLGIHG